MGERHKDIKELRWIGTIVPNVKYFLKMSSFFEIGLVISEKLLIFVADLIIKILKLCSISI